MLFSVTWSHCRRHFLDFLVHCFVIFIWRLFLLNLIQNKLNEFSSICYWAMCFCSVLKYIASQAIATLIVSQHVCLSVCPHFKNASSPAVLVGISWYFNTMFSYTQTVYVILIGSGSRPYDVSNDVMKSAISEISYDDISGGSTSCLILHEVDRTRSLLYFCLFFVNISQVIGWERWVFCVCREIGWEDCLQNDQYKVLNRSLNLTHPTPLNQTKLQAYNRMPSALNVTDKVIRTSDIFVNYIELEDFHIWNKFNNAGGTTRVRKSKKTAEDQKVLRHNHTKSEIWK